MAAGDPGLDLDQPGDRLGVGQGADVDVSGEGRLRRLAVFVEQTLQVFLFGDLVLVAFA